MSFQRATRVGHYEITAQLGEGGMGEVYRAQDRKLGREVAIKMLPPDLATDPERLARFEREAKLLASLNHPNIASDLWPRGVGRHPRSGHGAGRGTDPRRAPGGRAAAARGGARDRAADRRGARSGARARDHSPRPQARQHQAAPRRGGEGPRFRAGQGDGEGRRHSERHADRALADHHLHGHRPRHDPGNGGLHGAGASGGVPGRLPRRHLGLRGGAVGDALGAVALRRRDGVARAGRCAQGRAALRRPAARHAAGDPRSAATLSGQEAQAAAAIDRRRAGGDRGDDRRSISGDPGACGARRRAPSGARPAGTAVADRRGGGRRRSS